MIGASGPFCTCTASGYPLCSSLNTAPFPATRIAYPTPSYRPTNLAFASTQYGLPTLTGTGCIHPRLTQCRSVFPHGGVWYCLAAHSLRVSLDMGSRAIRRCSAIQPRRHHRSLNIGQVPCSNDQPRIATEATQQVRVNRIALGPFRFP